MKNTDKNDNISPRELTLKRAKEYGISKKSYIDEIDTGYCNGNVILSSDPKETHYKGTKFKVKDVDEFKELTGIADSEYDNGNYEYHHQIPPPFTKEMAKNLELNMKHICAAHDIYLFGDSKQVESYKKVLNKTYYPMDVMVYIVKLNIFVRAGDILQIKKQNAILSAGTVTVEKGGAIEWRTGGKLTADKMIMDAPPEKPELAADAPPPPPYNYGSIGETHQKSKNGATPTFQPQNGGGSTSISGKSTCDKPAGTGDPGIPGIPAGSGDPGLRGGDSSPINTSVPYISGVVTVATKGGNGGEGGDGGTGGIGGQGGPGGAKSTHCDQGPGGTGALGGQGGTGGLGGNGGDGKDVTIVYSSGDPVWKVIAGGSVGGNNGKTLGGGGGGGGGEGVPPGGSLGTGPNGIKPTGTPKPGVAGQVIINGKVKPPNN